MGALVVFLLLAIMASITQSCWVPTQTHLLMPHWGAAGLHTPSVYFDSWRFGVETNNVRGWRVVPKTCAEYVGNYMTSAQYGSDCNAVVDEAIKYMVITCWVPTQTHLLMPHWGAAGLHTPAVNCDSWRFGVETNNVRGWRVVPKTCAEYVGNYMKSAQYGSDCNAVVDEAIKYVDGLTIAEDYIWIFDIDETALSNLPYYEREDVAFGSKEHNRDTFLEWVKQAKAPPLDAALKLYKHLITKKVKIVFLTAISDEYETFRKQNLEAAGYKTWEKLILRPKDLHGANFKSAKREELEGDKYNYKIIGNVGDQWSDIIGTNVGNRTFKLPNPMYYV